MNRPLTATENQLLALVRASLWQKPADEKAFLNETVDWNMIGKLAMEQTVGGLAFEAALSMPENLLPPKEWKLKAIAFLETNRRTHFHVNKCSAEAVKGLRDEGIDAALLKGQAYASAYLKPEMRQCGDIDLYVGEDNYYAAYLAVKDLGWESVDEFKAEEKHCGFNLHGVKIELHKVAAKIIPKSVDKKFQKWSCNQVMRSGRTVSLADVTVRVPTPLFDIVFVFLHLYHHFLNGGIGLRHICDWAMLLHVYSDEIDPEELRVLLNKFQLLKAWKSFAPILVLRLELPEEECLLFSKGYEKQAEKILSAVLEEGNFGRAKARTDKRPDGYFAGKIHSVRVVSSKYLKKFRFDPKRIIRLFCSFIVRGTIRVIKDMKKGVGR